MAFVKETLDSRFRGNDERADVPFLQLAHVGKAEHLVTGDRDLLTLANQFTCAIMKPEAWLQTLPKVA